MSVINPDAFNELPRAKKEVPKYTEEYKEIQEEANDKIKLNREKEREAYLKAQLFIARSVDKDPVMTLIGLIRNARNEEEARTMLINNFNLLLEDEEINYLINNNIEEQTEPEAKILKKINK